LMLNCDSIPTLSSSPICGFVHLDLKSRVRVIVHTKPASTKSSYDSRSRDVHRACP
jgi:hypothetical protein